MLVKAREEGLNVKKYWVKQVLTLFHCTGPLL